MPRTNASLVSLVFLVALAANAVQPGHAQTKPGLYPAPAALSQYLIADKSTEIEMARSAAPASISGDAEVLTLEMTGYTTAMKGTNGFVCLVERSWAKSTDDPEFWSPKVMAPVCLNAPAAKTYLPIVMMKTRMVLAGKSRTEIAAAVKSGLDSGKLPSLDANAMCYMMSKRQYLSDQDTHWHPHMMWFVAGDAVQTWGANLAGVPVFAGSVPEDRMTVFMLSVEHWSDGTLATH